MTEQVQNEGHKVSDDSDFVEQYDWQDEMMGHGMQDISSAAASVFLAVVAWVAVVVCIGFVAFELGRVILNG